MTNVGSEHEARCYKTGTGSPHLVCPREHKIPYNTIGLANPYLTCRPMSMGSHLATDNCGGVAGSGSNSRFNRTNPPTGMDASTIKYML